METRRLGRLGHESSVLIYGAAALASATEEVAERSLAEALDAGINHVDVAADYGEAERLLGPLVPAVRERIFLATKTGEREREDAWAQINRSLELLRTDRVDLLQLHAVGTAEDLEAVTRPGGALEAAVRAADQGLVGAVGITGHGTRAAQTHLEALRRYPFATVLTPLNAALWQDPTFRTHYSALVEEVRRQDAALLTIKTLARRNWPGVAAGEPLGDQPATTWYEPLTDAERIRAAVSWSLAHDEVTGLATAGDVRLLGSMIAAERDRMDPAGAERLLLDDPAYTSPFEALPAGL